MKISVVIPAYNSSATIEATLDSVLRQTLQPDEILVLDDGSIDNTASLLYAYKPRVAVFRQENRGVANARNLLWQLAKGDLIAFLDHDDIWHPNYLEVQLRLVNSCPHGAAFFTGHVNFNGNGSYTWGRANAIGALDSETIEPERFIKRYNKCPGPFGSMSFCCIPKTVLNELGPEPFPVTISGADDFYLFNVLPLSGPVVYTPIPFVAYRESDHAQSADRLKSVGLAVRALELIVKNGKMPPGSTGTRTFELTFASKRRDYAKLLFGAGRLAEARFQLRASLIGRSPLSLAKSFSLLLCTYLPVLFQSRWPARQRRWVGPQN